MYEIPEGWSYRNNGTSQEFPAYGSSGSYSLVSINNSSGSHLVLSDNGTFGLALLNLNGTGNYYLSIVMGTHFYKNTTAAAPVWTANRNKPAKDSALLVNSRGQLSLLESNMSAVWSSPNQTVITSFSLGEDGILKLHNSSGAAVWLSSDYPTDVLLPGQRLITGQKLTCRSNSTFMSVGIYSAVVEWSGVVLYLDTQKEPYFLWSLQGSLINNALQVCDGFRTVLSFTVSGGVSMVYEPIDPNSTKQACVLPLNVGLSSGGALTFLQLDYDGNLNTYKLDESGSWSIQFQLTQYLTGRQCKLPLPCGRYGVCDVSRGCQCLDQGVSNTTSTATTSCSKPAWASSPGNCSNRYETSFVQLSGGSYFSNQYSSPDRVSSTLDDCLEACRANCSCAALFYDGGRRSCYFMRELLGSLAVDPSANQLSAFIKYQDFSKLIPLSPPDQPDKKLIAGAASGVGTAVILIASGVFILCYYSSKRARADAEIIKLLNTMEGPPRRFSYRRLAYATKGFSKQLGNGGFGSVYEGAFQDGRKVAVKKLRSRNQGQKQFITEVASLGSISHINIVKLFGFCADSAHRLLVYEFMPNGSLDKWIFDRADSPLDWPLRYNIAVGTARGLAYLHEESREPIIHLDIKPQNILLDENFAAKVGDFGMAKLLMNREISHVVTGVRGTPGYLAPEWLLQSTATKKCDVYSYGMVLLELVGGRKNLDPTKLDSNLSWFFPAWAVNEARQGRTLNIVDPRVRDHAQAAEAERMVKVAFWCIQENPAARPTMDAVVQMLEFQQEVSEPPLTFRFAVQSTGVLSITSSGEHTAVGYSEHPRTNGTLTSAPSIAR